MAVTKLTDIVFNTVFAKYFLKASTDRSNLIKSGIAATDPVIAARCAAAMEGKLVNLPYWNGISGDASVLSDTVALVAGAITAGQDVAVALRRGKAWGSNDLAAEIAGDDPMKTIAERLADYWNSQKQKAIFATLKGVFASNIANNAGDLVLDISGETGEDAILGKDTLLYAAQLLGDAKENLTAIAMHSAAETVLNIAGNGGSLFKPADTPAGLASYNGRSVVMDDNCVYDAATKKAEIFLFGRGAVALNDVPSKTPLETTREALAGNDVLITRQAWIGHIRGVKYNAASCAGATPTNAELEAAANWTRVWDQKDVRVVKLICKLA